MGKPPFVLDQRRPPGAAEPAPLLVRAVAWPRSAVTRVLSVHARVQVKPARWHSTRRGLLATPPAARRGHDRHPKMAATLKEQLHRSKRLISSQQQRPSAAGGSSGITKAANASVLRKRNGTVSQVYASPEALACSRARMPTHSAATVSSLHCTHCASLASCTHGPAAQRAREAPLPRARPDDLSDKEFDEKDVRAAQRAANQGRASSHT